MMNTLLEMVVYLGSMAAILAAIRAIGTYRRARLGPGYRGEKDAAIRLALVVLGGVLIILICLITQAAHPSLQWTHRS